MKLLRSIYIVLSSPAIRSIVLDLVDNGRLDGSYIDKKFRLLTNDKIIDTDKDAA